MLVNAFNATTGEPQRVPKHWIGHPVLGVNLTLKAPKIKDDGGSITPGTPEAVKVTAKTVKQQEAGNAEDHR